MAYHKSCFNIGELHTTENESIPSVSSSSQEINEKLKQKEKEIDILKKCKEELSNTVITLKQEIYSLREEKLKMEKYNKEIKSKLLMMSERNAALVQEKANLNLENQKLKVEMLSMNEARYNLQSQIGQANIPFNTYPWIFRTEKSIVPFTSSPVGNPYLYKFKSHNDCKENISESWEEVSQKLFAQMKVEMKDLEELGKKLSLESMENELCESCCSDIEDKNLSENDFIEKINSVEDEAEKIIIEQQYQLRNVRKHAVEQNKTVRKLLQKILGFTKSGNSSPLITSTNQRNMAKIYDINDKFDSDMISNIENKFQFTRPSDESFRAYFTKQLHNGGQLLQNPQSKSYINEKLKNISANGVETIADNAVGVDQKINNTAKHKQEDILIDKIIPKEICVQNDCIIVNETKSTNHERNISIDEDRICPMCQAFFPKTVSQDDFETHVVSHFEVENTSILENFEVI